MALDLNQIKNRLNTLQNQFSKQDSLWKPSGKTQIRIVPYKFNKDNPFIELLFHYNLGGKNYLSPASFGRPDPIMEFADKLRVTGNKDDYKLAKVLEPKLRTFAPIVVRGKEEEGVKFWGFGKMVYQDLLGVIADADYGDITDPATGRDIVVEFMSAEESGKSFPSTTIRVKPNKTYLTESKEVLVKIMESQRPITEVYKELTYDQLKDILANWLKPENKNKKVAETDDSDEVTVDSEPEVHAPVKKKSSPVSPSSNADDITSEFNKLFES
jgi:hypothetical protein